MTKPDSKSRLAYIDWMRGLACVLMFQTHCYDSWLSPEARRGDFYMYSQLGGTFPAPLFLFLAGASFALVTTKLQQKNWTPGQIARFTIRRGAEIFGFGLLLRLQEYVLAWGWSPVSDFFRVDILNCIGASMMLMGVLCWLVSACGAGTPARELPKSTSEPGAPLLPHILRQGWESMPPKKTEAGAPSARFLRGWETIQPTPYSLAAIGTALPISLLSPLLWTTWRPDWLPWPIESYINGVHNLGKPQSWLFPLFPWSAFAFAGLATGFLLFSDWARGREVRIFFSLGGVGLALIELSRWLDHQSWQVYPVYDYWHTSPEFFLARLGMLLVILTASYAWCKWVIGKLQAALFGFSPLIQLGQASLLVYWVHLEFVYGKFSILHKRGVNIQTATLGLLTITVAMTILAYVRTHPPKWIAWRKPQLAS